MMEPRFKQEIQQMMYIAGETQDPSTKTVKLIEDIIRDQVVHMLKTANDLAARRGSRVFSNNDLIFQFRHDAARVERLRTFLAWKAIRRTVKDSDDKDSFADDDLEAPAQEETSSGPAGKPKFPTVTLPWDVSSFFSETPPDTGLDNEEATNNSAAALEKLRRNDERTRGMTVAEYATWSEYRHASLTYRRARRFRDWCGLGIIADNRPGDDVMDILGFLTAEMVQGLTAEALAVRRAEAARLGERTGARGEAAEERGLFSAPEGAGEPVGERHVRVAFQRMQGRTKKSRALLNGTRLPVSPGLVLVSEHQDAWT